MVIFYNVHDGELRASYRISDSQLTSACSPFVVVSRLIGFADHDISIAFEMASEEQRRFIERTEEFKTELFGRLHTLNLMAAEKFSVERLHSLFRFVEHTSCLSFLPCLIARAPLPCDTVLQASAKRSRSRCRRRRHC